MNFGWAIEKLKAGNKVTRKGWNGKGQYIWLMPATTVKAEWCKEPVLKKLAEDNGGEIECLGTIRMYTHDSTGRKAVLTGWLASQSDMLAEDWDYACVSPEDEQDSIAKLPKEDLPVWPEVNADGYARMGKDSDVVIHDGVYRPKKEPVFGNTKLSFDKNGQPRMGDTMTVEEYQKVHSGEKHTFKDLCDDYLEQQKGKVQINPLPFTTTLERLVGEPVGESWPELKKVWTTYWDLDIQITGSLIDKADYPYTLCERDVIEQKQDKLVVLAEPGFSQRTVTLHLNENCWMDAKDASASLIHRVTNRFGWNTEFFISLLNGIEHTDGDWCKPCSEGDNRSLGDLFTEDMEFLAQEQARVAHSFYYTINQYLRLVQTTAPERQRREILAKYEASLRQHRTVFDGLSKKNTNQEKEN